MRSIATKEISFPQEKPMAAETILQEELLLAGCYLAD
jgi:hypothetical protein